MSRIGEKIKDIRIKKNMSQKELAKKLGASEKFIVEVESGRRVVSDVLIKNFSKALGQNIDDLSVSFEAEVFPDEKEVKASKPIASKEKTIDPKEPAKEIWQDAFSSVLKAVPIYGYDLVKATGYKELPILSNKVEGIPLDKAVYIKIEEDDMIGYRIGKGDLALTYITSEVINDTICLIEYDGKRAIRQIKRLDNKNLLLLSNKGSVKTETVGIKDVAILGKLQKVEITL
jgi:transcriptional regulator with XRE-family HTH domain